MLFVIIFLYFLCYTIKNKSKIEVVKMNIIISPAKKMKVSSDDFLIEDMPCFIDKTKILLKELSRKSYDELKLLLCCNDKIASLNYDRYKNMDLMHNLTPALFSYEGIQYKNYSLLYKT